MRNFKVLVIAHSLKQNKVAKYGDLVFESQLTSPADELTSAGFIEEVFECKTGDIKESVKSPADELTKEDVSVDLKKEVKNIGKQFKKH